MSQRGLGQLVGGVVLLGGLLVATRHHASSQPDTVPLVVADLAQAAFDGSAAPSVDQIAPTNETSSTEGRPEETDAVVASTTADTIETAIVPALRSPGVNAVPRAGNNANGGRLRTARQHGGSAASKGGGAAIDPALLWMQLALCQTDSNRPYLIGNEIGWWIEWDNLVRRGPDAITGLVSEIGGFVALCWEGDLVVVRGREQDPETGKWLVDVRHIDTSRIADTTAGLQAYNGGERIWSGRDEGPRDKHPERRRVVKRRNSDLGIDGYAKGRQLFRGNPEPAAD